MPKPALVRDDWRGERDHRGLAEGVQRGATALLVGLQDTKTVCRRVSAGSRCLTPQQQQLQVINSPVLGAKTAAQSDPKRRVSMQGDYIGPDNGVFVNQNEYHVAPIGTPLATAGVNTCSVLIVIDRQNQRHYLAHIDSSSTPGQIAKTVQDNFPSLNGLEVYLMEGMQPSGTSQNIYSALQQLGLEKRLQFISFQGTGFPQVGTQNETIFNPAITFSKKSNQRVAK